MADYIFNQSINLKERPSYFVYYVTCGKWVEDSNLMDIKHKCEKFISDLNYFNYIKFIPINLVKLSSIYKEISNAISREIITSKTVFSSQYQRC